MLERGCPKCKKSISYKTIEAYKQAEEKQTLCKECRVGKELFFRNCPECNIQLGYTKEKYFNHAVKNNTVCRCCKNKPKLCSCVICNKELQYKTQIKTYCDECYKNKFLEEGGERKCPGCNSIITYNTKYDRIRAEEKGTKCLKCLGEGRSKKRKGVTLIDVWISKGMSKEEAIVKFQDMETRRLKTREGYKHSQDTKDKMVATRLASDGYTHSKKSKETMSLLKKELLASGWTNVNNHSVKFIIEGLVCQGNWERMFIENLIKENKKLPTKPKGIKTSIGYYFPDFEYEDKLIEIKSPFTYEIFIGTKQGKYSGHNQFKKVLEASHTKPIELLVLDSKGMVVKREWYENGQCTIKQENP